ncbi:MAG: Clp1/GlmU family protein [Candidatus Methylomirabilaceae bacterium]
MFEVTDVPNTWRALASRLEVEPGLTLLLGISDSGKTTLARWLLRTLTAAGRRVALLDGDIGQSTIGPPATAALALASPGFPDSNLEPAALRFIGAVSPADQMLPLAAALKGLADKAFAMGAEIGLVDTTGLVLGPLGRRLKFHKIDLLAPRHLAALQNDDEVEPILRLFEGRAGMAIHRLQVSPHVAARSPQVRRIYRAERFAEYLEASAPLELSLSDVAVQGSWFAGGKGLDLPELRHLSNELQAPVLAGERVQDDIVLLVQGEPSPEGRQLARSRLGVLTIRIVETDAIRGLLLGLADQENELLALALLQHLDPRSAKLVCLSQWREPTKVRLVHFGTLRLDPSGAELDGSSAPPESHDEPGDRQAVQRDR